MPHATSDNRARRILVYGVTGSGKTMAAERISALTGHPLTRADELTWLPGWVPVPQQSQREVFASVVAEDRWVLDTAYGAWLDVVLPRVELIVGLDYPRWFSLQRLIRRTLTRTIDKLPVCNGNTESLRGIFGQESIIRWHFRSFAGKRLRMRQWAAATDGPPVLIFTRPKDLQRWISRLGEPSATDSTSPDTH